MGFFAVHKNMVPENGAFTKSSQKLMGCFFCVPQAVVQWSFYLQVGKMDVSENSGTPKSSIKK